MTAYPARDISQLNTLKVPARARHFMEAGSLEEVQKACAWARQHQVRVLVLGGGSNIIARNNIDALVLKPDLRGIVPLPRSQHQSPDHQMIAVGAGENWHELVQHTLKQGWYGLENLSLIPGLVGAAPVQNIGAYGVELREVFHSLEAVNIATGEVECFDKARCAFAYRDSVFKKDANNQYVIIRVKLLLSLKPQVNIRYPALAEALSHLAPEAITPQDVSDAVCTVRRAKLPDPDRIPNCGSFFKNPIVDEGAYRRLHNQFPDLVAFDTGQGNHKLAAGWLIEKAGWKGRSLQGVMVHPQQALVLTNPDRLGGDAVLEAAAVVRRDIRAKFGVELELEPRLFG